jgi:2',3'-cyclic-nucleotide 2'-phosphodiesterase/3'-nucleotidase
MRRGFSTAARLLCILAGLAAAGAREVPLRILHTTDLHGRILPTRDYDGNDGVGGLLRGATEIRALRAAATHVLLLDVGDLYQGSLEGWISRGQVMTRALAALNYDAWTIGNHEFDWGLEVLQKAVAGSTVPVLGANILPRDTGPGPLPQVKPFRMFEFDGVRVAVVGLTTPGIPSWSLPDQYEGLRFEDSVACLRRILPAVQAERPDVLVLAVHQGYRDFGDDHANQVGAIAAAFPEFHVILGAHTHQLVEGRPLRDAWYAQAGYYGIRIGVVDLVYDTVARKVSRRASRLVPVTAATPEDPALASMFAKEIAAARAAAAGRVGAAEDRIDAKADAYGRSPVQQLLCRAVAEASGAEIVLHGALADEALEPGEVTLADVWRIVPYENRIGILHLTTGELAAVLAENAARRGSVNFMGARGLRWVETGKPPEPVKISELRNEAGKPFHARRRIPVAFNSYVIASAGLRFTSVRDLARKPECRLEILDLRTRDTVIEYLKRHGPLRRDALLAVP